eukprot:SAG31_NODE_21057_length_558_cov_2.450980_1_plen_72_part_10
MCIPAGRPSVLAEQCGHVLQVNAVGSIKATAGELLLLETYDAVVRTGRDAATSVGEQLNLTSTAMNAAAALT